MFDVIGCCVAVGAGLLLVGWFIAFGVGYEKGRKEGVDNQYNVWMNINDGLRKDHGKQLASVTEQHEADLRSLRERCAKFVEALADADEAAGYQPAIGLVHGMRVERVPLRINDARKGKDS